MKSIIYIMLKDHVKLKENMLKHKKNVCSKRMFCNTKKDVCFKKLLITHNIKKCIYLKDNKSQLKNAKD